MANRTFKVYGQAYAASGDVTATLTINGTQVFSGAVNDSTTVREGQPTMQNHLFSFELDENTIGNLAYSLTVSGGELCLGPSVHNLAPAYYVPMSWFVDTAEGNWSAADQTYLANNISEEALDAQQAGLHAKLVAGTGTEADQEDLQAANASAPKSAETFVSVSDARLSAQINGEALAEWDDVAVNARNWPILQDGDTFTCTWVFDPTTLAGNT